MIASKIRSLVKRPASMALAGAFAAFTLANLIHNRLGLDLAIVPAAVLTFLYGWRGKRQLLWASAFFIGIPAALFFSGKALLDPYQTVYFVNHIALLLAAVLACLSFALSFTESIKGG
jgi:hypothetical protein